MYTSLISIVLFYKFYKIAKKKKIKSYNQTECHLSNGKNYSMKKNRQIHK